MEINPDWYLQFAEPMKDRESLLIYMTDPVLLQNSENTGE